MMKADPGSDLSNQQPRGDDFTRIHGIGPGIADRLTKAGIYTFAQLGTLSPEEVVHLLGNLIGLTAERVEKQDWIGQARELQPQNESTAGQIQPDVAPMERQHYATFTIELLLGGENEVRRTRVVSIQSEAEQAWAGWRGDRLLNFIIEHAELGLPPVEPPQVQVSYPETSLPQEAAAELSGSPRLEELVTIPGDDGGPNRLLPANRPFEVRLTLDLSDLLSPKDKPLSYATTFYAKKLGSGERKLVGEKRGTFTPAENITIETQGINLPEGLYRLEAAVVFSLPTEETIHSAELAAQLEGSLLRIY